MEWKFNWESDELEIWLESLKKEMKSISETIINEKLNLESKREFWESRKQ